MSRFLLLLLSALTVACGSSVSDLEGFDEELWKNDKAGCKGIRLKQRAEFEKLRPQLLGLSERNVISLLGRADHTELKERNEKKLIYFYTGGECASGSITGGKEGYFELKLNAVNLVKEINDVY